VHDVVQRTMAVHARFGKPLKIKASLLA